jgi:hypothetical protein
VFYVQKGVDSPIQRWRAWISIALRRWKGDASEDTFRPVASRDRRAFGDDNQMREGASARGVGAPVCGRVGFASRVPLPRITRSAPAAFCLRESKI